MHDGIKTFYVGNETAFDKVALAVLRALKKRYPHILYIVILTANPKNDSWLHEPTALFPNLAHVPYEVAIQKLHMWMTCRADLILCHMENDNPKVLHFINKAGRRQKKVVNMAKIGL